MSRKETVMNNACIESFHVVLKRALFINNNNAHVAQAQQDIGKYIEISIIVKESIQQMTIYRQPQKEPMYELKAA
ncbi:hypothetical protein CW304_16150 [Bacillus sp. UFRGS-B20]|nr:hypothetical protein CW304_16150 [Bacillus sp. UFRGS-B20]